MRFNPGDVEHVFKRIALERLDVTSRMRVDRLALGNGVRVDLLTHQIDHLIADLRSYIWTEVIQNETVTLKVQVAYPATWWQHLKQRWFTAWMLKRWPVMMVTVQKEESHRFKTLALLPEFRYEAPSGCGAYVIQTSVDRKY